MNKTILITGATSGIGLACARKFAANGDRVILTGRNEQRLAEIERELSTNHRRMLDCTCMVNKGMSAGVERIKANVTAPLMMPITKAAIIASL